MKMKKALLALALAAPAIAAAGEADHWYVTPEIGGISPDYRRSLQDQNWLFGLAVGREIDRYFNLDSKGSIAYNIRLSRRRAQAVREYLLGEGVDASQLTARGYGPRDPVASNRTADGRARNRRVVLEVLSNPNSVQVKGQGSTN